MNFQKYSPTPVGRCLRRNRERKGWSLEDVRDATGISKGLLSKLENHKDPNPCYNTLKTLAKGFGLTTRDFLRELGDWENPE